MSLGRTSHRGLFYYWHGQISWLKGSGYVSLIFLVSTPSQVVEKTGCVFGLHRSVWVYPTVARLSNWQPHSSPLLRPTLGIPPGCSLCLTRPNRSSAKPSGSPLEIDPELDHLSLPPLLPRTLVTGNLCLDCCQSHRSPDPALIPLLNRLTLPSVCM